MHYGDIENILGYRTWIKWILLIFSYSTVRVLMDLWKRNLQCIQSTERILWLSLSWGKRVFQLTTKNLFLLYDRNHPFWNNKAFIFPKIWSFYCVKKRWCHIIVKKLLTSGMLQNITFERLQCSVFVDMSDQRPIGVDLSYAWDRLYDYREPMVLYKQWRNS